MTGVVVYVPVLALAVFLALVSPALGAALWVNHYTHLDSCAVFVDVGGEMVYDGEERVPHGACPDSYLVVDGSR